MNFVIAVFRARTETINFTNLLRSYKIMCEIINTPRQVNVSCGISTKFTMQNLNTAREILTRRKFNTFAGFYLIKKIGNNLYVKPIY